jgi:hypothetical protein
MYEKKLREMIQTWRVDAVQARAMAALAPHGAGLRLRVYGAVLDACADTVEELLNPQPEGVQGQLALALGLDGGRVLRLPEKRAVQGPHERT